MIAPAFLCARPLTTTTESCTFFNGVRIGESSNPAPSATGVQLLITAPCGM
jgi:hypothetical protein